MKKTISYVSMGVALVSLLTLANCSKKDSPLPQIDGYNSSDDVASDALVSYFPFEGNTNDTKGGSTGTAVGVTYAAGVKGQAYQGAEAAYATVAPSAAFSSLPSYTISLWYKLPAHNTHTMGLFFLSGTNNLAELIYEIDNYKKNTGDTLEIHGGFTNLGVPSTSYQGFTMTSHDTSAYKTKWVNLVASYDGSSSTYVTYQDGTAILNNSAFGNVLAGVLFQNTSGPDATKPQGSLSWSTDAPKVITIGTWPPTLYGVSATLGSAGCFTGLMDEIRIYDRVLTTAEVGAIYQLGVAGR
jgi:hypothetical protein